MKYIGFFIPDTAFDGYDWIYDVIEGKGKNKFYLVSAKDPTEAKRKIFRDVFNKWDEDIKWIDASTRARHILEDFDEDDVVKKYGEKDGKKIIQISNEFLSLKEEQQKECELCCELIKQISINNLFELALEQVSTSIGISTFHEIKN